jgi:NADPH2:quinone reductase
MKALLQPDFEGPKTMHLVDDARVPTPGPGEILLRVTSAGLNFADVMRAHGLYYGGPKPPFIAGFEATGEVVVLGRGVDNIEPGQHVIGIGDGAFAEYMVMPAAGVTPIPEGWRDEQALGLVLNWATALAALQPMGRLTAGETVLIHAAAGGVGQAAVKMAKHYGATVIATASAGKHEIVRALGADHVIDYHTGNLAAKIREIVGKGGVDLVLESIGGETFKTSLAVARPITGRVVVFGAASGVATVTNAELIFHHHCYIIGLHIGSFAHKAPERFAELMEELQRLRIAGVYQPGEPIIYSLEEGPAALAALKSGSTVGKLALCP